MDKVSTASFQSLTYDGNAFVVIAPFYSHAVTAEGRACADCHGNADFWEQLGIDDPTGG